MVICGKRYNSLDYFFKNKFGTKVAKIPLSGGFTCPNRDGTRGVGGCIYCSDKLSGEFAGKPCDSIEKQFSDITQMMSKKWKNTKYMPYFQTGTATYAPVEKLKVLYEEAISQKDVVGLSIATRPDCLDNDILNLLNELNKQIPVWVELGFQTSNENTAKYINRGYPNDCLIKAINDLKSIGITVIVHIINGLPTDTKSDMINTVKFLSNLPIDGIKIHMLHIIKDTGMANLYLKENFYI